METSKTIKLPAADKEITFNAPTLGVVRAALHDVKNKTELDVIAIIIAKCCNIREEELNTYDFRDIGVLSKVARGFLDEAGMSEMVQ
ncbi:MAG: phage tail assembly protein [Campylobacteraceae bacterium]|jgi:hypothetical protein|nr:phage tail assembly protein [Campylobacteraceae bacterium]